MEAWYNRLHAILHLGMNKVWIGYISIRIKVWKNVAIPDDKILRIWALLLLLLASRSRLPLRRGRFSADVGVLGPDWAASYPLYSNSLELYGRDQPPFGVNVMISISA